MKKINGVIYLRTEGVVKTYPQKEEEVKPTASSAEPGRTEADRMGEGQPGQQKRLTWVAVNANPIQNLKHLLREKPAGGSEF